ncbi:MAG: dockerin type I repeat-containing protein [Clostridia bacterium]|nr:dockerin type I repeat-containing protein [Clostridia bacterium]
MKKRSVLRAAAFLCALAVLAVSASFPTASAEQSETVFYVRSDVSSDYVSLGDVITFSVDVSDCPGIAAGSLCASASSSVDFVSATFCGEDVPADLASGPNAGARVIDILDPDTDKKGFISDFCTFTYRVTGLDDVSFEFYTYECIVSEYTELVHSVSPSGPLVYHVAVPEKPVIKTASPLPKGAVGIAYSCPLESDGETEFTEWDLVSGSLPEGIELLNTGELSGTPSVFGVFSFSVTASVLGSVTSDPAEFELEILEKPAELVLVQGSTYAFESGEDVTYLIGVKEQTDVSAVISNFETPEYVSVFDAEGNVKSPTDTVGTGYTVRLMDGQNVMDSVTVVVLGDVSGDGRIATIDYQRVKGYVLGTFDLTGPYLVAGNVDRKNDIATIDYQRIKGHVLGTFDIFA